MEKDTALPKKPMPIRAAERVSAMVPPRPINGVDDDYREKMDEWVVLANAERAAWASVAMSLKSLSWSEATALDTEKLKALILQG